MRKVPAIALVVVMSLSGGVACSSSDSGARRALTKAADATAIAHLESVFHQTATSKDIDGMMGLFADDSVFTVGGQSVTGKQQIRDFLLKNAAPLRPENHWVAETPIYKIRVTNNGDRGTLYFECHYVDVDSRVVKSVVSADVKVSKLKDQWMFTNLVAAPATVS